MALDTTDVIVGTYGEVWHDGRWLTNITSCEATVEIEKEDVPRAGTRWRGHKVVGLNGTGSMSGYKVTSEFVERIGSVARNNGPEFVTELIVTLKNPDALKAYRVRLKNVTFDSIPLINYEVGSLVEEELNFTFSDYELLDRF